MKIFISYRRADSATITGRIYEHLVAAFGDECIFRDINDIPVGKDFRIILENALSECDIMLVIIGPKWASIEDAKGNPRLHDPNDFVRIEVETGLNREGFLVVPVLVTGAGMPSPENLPKSLGEIAYRNAANIRNDPDFITDIQKLISDISSEKQVPIQHFEPETIYIPTGKFWMGNPANLGVPEYETPQHEVFLSAYRIGKYPITNAQYEEFVRQTGTSVHPDMGWHGNRVAPGTENHPVTAVTWYEASRYCEWLRKITGREYRLPNEAQWERAARGSDKRIYPWGDEFKADRCNQGHAQVSSVDAYPAQSPTGCFDLVGNVYQWTCSLWGEKAAAPDARYLYEWKNDIHNDLNANRQIRRVVRGSSQRDTPKQMRCSLRTGQLPDDRGVFGAQHGFRVVWEL